MTTSLNDQVRTYWEREPCGTSPSLIGDVPAGTPAWFERIEEQRYRIEPFIHSTAQFTRHHGKRILEVGVGAGTDHLQWARAGCECYGVDLTDAAIETTRARLATYGFASQLQRANAEQLPFASGMFDVVYSWGVIHHAEHPDRIHSQIYRVLKHGGVFIGMLYGRHSLVAVKRWIRYALLKGRPWQSLGDVLWNYMESTGTKAYTESELRRSFSQYSHLVLQPILTAHDIAAIPHLLVPFLPSSLGWFITIVAVK